MAKQYFGTWGVTGPHVHVVDGPSKRKLNERFDLANRSPDGFNWGYGGSGPSQLALALCADVMGDDQVALAIYQPFKWRFVAPLPQRAAWQADYADLREIMEDIIASRA